MDEESDDKDDTKRKSRNLSEKKRRDQFNSLVNDLSALITTSNRKMDKSTVLKSTITFLKHHNEAADRSKVFEIQQDWKPPFLTNDEFTHLMLEAIDGFILVFSSSGAIYYASDNITSLLGYLPSDVLNVSIFDLTHTMNHDSICSIFRNQTPANISPSSPVTFHTHVKRGNIDRLDLNAYELVKFVGYFRAESNENLPMNNTQSPPHNIMGPGGQAAEADTKVVFVGTGRLVTPQLIREMSAIDPTLNEFTSKHSLEWKFLFLDHRAPPIIGYLPFEVLGTSGYDYYHFDDLDDIVSDHEELMHKGEGKSGFYRFLTKGQQWIWLQTTFFVSYHQSSSKPDYVVCTHKVFSNADVIKQSKMGRGKKPRAPNPSSSKTSTVTLKDIEPSHGCAIPSAVLPTANIGSGATTASAILGDISPIFEQSKAWADLSNPTNAQAASLKTTHPSTNYGNLNSEDLSPNIKRKRYSSHNCGNESDSTSMSADSKTSRYSLLTHLSSHIKRRKSMSHTHPTTQQMHGQHEQHQMHNHLHQQQQQQSSIRHAQAHALQLNPSPAQAKRCPMLQQQSLAPGQMMANTNCQFTPRAFPFQSTPLVGPAFLESSQFLTAIPVQPVIAPFSVSPVPISPMTLSLPSVAGNSNSLLQPSCVQHEMEPASTFVITPNQAQLQDQLQLKHDELQKLIMQQQDELRMVSEQLLLSRYSLQQPLLPMSYNNASGGSSRNLHCVNNSLDQHGFNQYSFAMSDGQQQQQQHAMQQQLHTPQQQQMLQQSSQQLHSQQSHQHHQSQQPASQQHQDQQQNLFQRSVPDLEQFGEEEIDAFLNLSPLQSLVSLQTGLNQAGEPTSNNNNSVINNKANPNQGLQQHNEDPLLSYIQMTPEPSLGMNFQMGLSDDGSESQSEDTKLLYNHLDPQPHQQQNSSYFSADPLQSVSQPVSTNRMPSDLDILPYQVLREESQNLLNSSHIPPGV